MDENGKNVSKQTLFISIAVALLVGFLSGVIYSDRSPQPGGQIAQQPNLPAQNQQQDQLLQQIESLQLTVQQNPDNAQAWTQLGHAYFDTNQPAKAIEAYNKSLAIIPGNPPVLTDLGVMYRRNGQPDKAIESFDKALEASPGFEQALFNKGIVQYNDLDDLEGAIQSWRELIRVNPGAKAPNGIPLATMVDDLSKELQN
ncbi:MAG: tetratricopeptide repeat protein [Desulfobulbaceae bacterium]|nr:tetratricopeptide repeat protein [Desulfobulbaceae bacterium]